MTPAVRTVHPAEIPAIAALIAFAFDTLDQNHSLVPDDTDRLRVMTDFFALITHAAPATGTVDIIADPTGTPTAAAVWFDRTRPTPPDPAYEQKLAALAGPYRPNFEALDRLLDAHHPQEPHWHLALLAVHPDHRRAGLGTALLHHRHTRLDTPTYLEATNAENIRLYRRHGYRTLNPFAIHLPDGTPFYRLWRAAR